MKTLTYILAAIVAVSTLSGCGAKQKFLTKDYSEPYGNLVKFHGKNPKEKFKDNRINIVFEHDASKFNPIFSTAWERVKKDVVSDVQKTGNIVTADGAKYIVRLEEVLMWTHDPRDTKGISTGLPGQVAIQTGASLITALVLDVADKVYVANKEPVSKEEAEEVMAEKIDEDTWMQSEIRFTIVAPDGSERGMTQHSSSPSKMSNQDFLNPRISLSEAIAEYFEKVPSK